MKKKLFLKILLAYLSLSSYGEWPRMGIYCQKEKKYDIDKKKSMRQKKLLILGYLSSRYGLPNSNFE